VSLPTLPKIEDLGGVADFHRADDGTRVRFARFTPETPTTRTLFLPGFTEFIEQHLETVAEFLERGHEVLILDWRGQGLSDRAAAERTRGHVASMDLFISDLRGILAETGFMGGAGPRILLGHSMGGHLALRAAMEIEVLFDRIVLCAPMIDINTRPFPRALAPVLADLACAMGLSTRYLPGTGEYDAQNYAFEGNLLTHDARRFQRTHDQIARTPDLAIGNPTFGWVRAAFRSMTRTCDPKRLATLSQPVLVFKAGEEKIVSNAAIDRLVRDLPDGHLEEITDARHEILCETDEIRGVFWRETDRFLAS